MVKGVFLQVEVAPFKDTVKPVYNGHPWDPKILAVVDKWPLFRGFSIKIAIEFDLAGLRLTVVGHCLEVAVNTGLTVPLKNFSNKYKTLPIISSILFFLLPYLLSVSKWYQRRSLESDPR